MLTTDFKRADKTVVSLGPFIKDVCNLEWDGGEGERDKISLKFVDEQS